MLKQSGHGHDPSGIMQTVTGECTVLCPVCPHPGINLLDDWESAPPDKQYIYQSPLMTISADITNRWLYAGFIAINANFRLKCKNDSNNAMDPSLSCGWTYFVGDTEYKTFLNEHQHDIQEVCIHTPRSNFLLLH